MSQSRENFHFFWGKESPLSQWHSCEFKDDENTYSSTEQYMMYQKASLFKSVQFKHKILKNNNPKVIKSFGRAIPGFNQSIWDKNKVRIVTAGNMLKFSQNEDLKQALLDTGDKTLVEASPYDCVWGIGWKESHPSASIPKLWRGQNLLGQCLMEVRSALAAEPQEQEVAQVVEPQVEEVQEEPQAEPVAQEPEQEAEVAQVVEPVEEPQAEPIETQVVEEPESQEPEQEAESEPVEVVEEPEPQEPEQEQPEEPVEESVAQEQPEPQEQEEEKSKRGRNGQFKKRRGRKPRSQ